MSRFFECLIAFAEWVPPWVIIWGAAMVAWLFVKGAGDASAQGGNDV